MTGGPVDLHAADEAWLRRAVDLARQGRPDGADPNPRVGALLVDAGGVVVGGGFHAGAGTPHAEVVALREAGGRAEGATAYVSLEPCAHTGRTGPCADALLAAGVARVVYAGADPTVEAAGGADRLRAAGVRVQHHPLTAAEELNRRWTAAVTSGRPFVTWKVGATLDGRVAAADGTSRWITGPQARRDVHLLRAEVGAIVVGTGTALVDDPALTVRDEAGEPVGRQPLRVVVGRREVPAGAAVRADDHWLQIDSPDPFDTLKPLHDKQIRHVLLEGGPTLAAAWLQAGAIDEVRAYVAPTLLGAGPALVGELGVATIAEAVRLELADVARLGEDVRLTLRPAPARTNPTTPVPEED